MRKITNITISIILIFAAYFLAIKPLIVNKILLSRNYAFTCAIVISKEGAVNGGADFNIVYNVNNVKYKQFFSKDSRYDVHVGDSYWVKYYPPDPDIGKIYLDIPCSQPKPDFK